MSANIPRQHKLSTDPLIWFPFYMGEFLCETQGFTDSEYVAHHRLIIWYASNLRPLPNNDAELARITGRTPNQWKKIRTRVLSLYSFSGGGWVLPRLKTQVETALEKRIKCREAGRKGGRASAEKRSHEHLSKDSQNSSERCSECSSERSTNHNYSYKEPPDVSISTNGGAGIHENVNENDQFCDDLKSAASGGPR